MKILIPVDASRAALAPIESLAQETRRGPRPEVLLLNVQPHFHRHVSQFTRRSDRDALRAERSREAMAAAIEALSRSGLAFRAMSDVGVPAERIATVADTERVDEIRIGVGRHPAWLRWLNPSIAQGVMRRTDIPVKVYARGRVTLLERYAVPAGVAGIAALLIAAE